jgi:hypothetical protein
VVIGGNEEFGRELTAAELKEKTVVILGRDGDPACITTWVGTIGEKFISFQAGEIGLIFIAKRMPDGTLQDDKSRRIHVFEYLGDI